MSRRILSILLVFVMLVGAAGCGGGTGTGTASTSTAGSGAASTADSSAAPVSSGPERSRIVNIGFSTKPRTIDPGNYTDPGTDTSVTMSYEPLVHSDHAGIYSPLLATEWAMSEDGSVWTLKLRQGVLFHDGDTFDADDVVFSYQRQLDAEGELVMLMQYVPTLEAVEKIDDYTVKFTFDSPTPTALNGFRAIPVYSKDTHDKVGDEMFNLVEHANGTGPWVFDEWIDGQYSHFTKNPNYWDKANYDPYFEEVYIRHVSEPSSAVAAHLSGDLDAYIPYGGIDNDLLPLYAGTEQKTELLDFMTNTNLYIALSFKEGQVWRDYDVRKAFSLSIDRASIMNLILGKGEVSRGYFYEGVVGTDRSIEPFEYNPEAAKELLATTGYDGRNIEIIGSPNTPKGAEISQAIADMAKQAGFNITMTVLDTAIYGTRRNSGDYDAYMTTVQFVDGLPFRLLNSNFVTDNMKTEYSNTEIRDRIVAASQELDEQKREQLVKEANKLICEDLPQILIGTMAVTYAQDYGLTGVEFYTDGLQHFTYVDYDPSLVK